MLGCLSGLPLDVSEMLSCLQVFAVRVQWAQGYQTPAHLQPANGNTGGLPPATMTDLLAHKDPRTGLTPLMAAVTKGHLSVAQMVQPHSVLTPSQLWEAWHRRRNTTDSCQANILSNACIGSNCRWLL